MLSSRCVPSLNSPKSPRGAHPSKGNEEVLPTMWVSQKGIESVVLLGFLSTAYANYHLKKGGSYRRETLLPSSLNGLLWRHVIKMAKEKSTKGNGSTITKATSMLRALGIPGGCMCKIIIREIALSQRGVLLETTVLLRGLANNSILCSEKRFSIWTIDSVGGREQTAWPACSYVGHEPTSK